MHGAWLYCKSMEACNRAGTRCVCLGVMLLTVDRCVIEECLGAIVWVSLIAVQECKCSGP